jgi:hypothetical protein
VRTAPAAPRIRRCTVAQDGHTLGEEALYQALWNNARPEGRESRVITVGWRGMSAHAQKLIRKLAIEVIGGYNVPEQIGTTYRVHSYRAILERRRKAGLEWVVRSRGVEFVDPVTGIEITPGVVSPAGAGPGPGLAAASGAEAAPTPATRVETGPAPGVAATTQAGNPEESIQETAAELAAVIRELQLHGPAGDEAGRQLLHACRSRAADATLEEILSFIRLKAGSPGIRKPVGFLLATVPRCFEGEAFRQFRAEKELRLAEESRRRDRLRRELEAVLEDPQASAEEKRWAREALEQGGEAP